MKDLVILIATVSWLAGIAIAKGFFPTALAMVVPFYSWYLVVESFLASTGVI